MSITGRESVVIYCQRDALCVYVDGEGLPCRFTGLERTYALGPPLSMKTWLLRDEERILVEAPRIDICHRDRND